jgi:branched-subunit amino acid transport protein AzlD
MSDAILIAALAGAATWAFRFLPTRVDIARIPKDGALSRFFVATGPAAIAALLAASILPEIVPTLRQPISLVAGIAAVCAVFVGTRSVVMSTLTGSIIYGVIFWLVN